MPEIQVRKILVRYFRPVMKYPQGGIVHMGDCQIHRPLEVYPHATCTCGLLHDLTCLGDWGLATKLYPQASEEEARAEMGRRYDHETWIREYEERIATTLEELLGKVVMIEGPSDADHWDLIRRVFGDHSELIQTRYEAEHYF